MNLVQRVAKVGGRLVPIIIEHGLTNGTGLMNPSIFIDDDGDILVNLRHVNYTLYHSENDQRFPSYWGPLQYLHPENDIRLGTENYLCKLDPDTLEVVSHTKVEMMELHTPVWEFTGLEDARLVEWWGNYFLIGVRRDTTTNGQGRMEYTKLEIDKENWTAKEDWRYRVPAPGDDSSYCEKNWVPVLDQKSVFVKWHNPVEVVRANPDHTDVIKLSASSLDIKDQRGGSQVVPWNDGYISITHEVDLFNNYLGQKDGIYRHRLIVWSKDLDLLGLSDPFTFLDARIEFCTGLAVRDNDVLITFGFQDNAAFVLSAPHSIINELITEATK